MNVTFVYGKTAKFTHILGPDKSANEASSAPCGAGVMNSFTWFGTGSQDEYDKAASLPMCKRCLVAARDCGWDLGPKWNIPDAVPGMLTIPTGEGDVDLVAVQRVLAGQRTPLTAADRVYALRELLRSTLVDPAQTSGPRAVPDPRYVLASIGMGTTVHAVAQGVHFQKRLMTKRGLISV